MNTTTTRILCIGAALAVFASTVALAQPPNGEAPPQEIEAPPVETPVEPPVEAPPAQPAHETVCDDHQDDDHDGLADCADADCYEAPACQTGGRSEANDERCSDWIDNDGDGAVDCDDSECSGPGITVCTGSYHGPPGPGGGTDAGDDGDIPELTGDMTVEDLIGNFGDADGERNDYLCSDGIDNDGDGRIDCADFGCRFDTQVTVCQGSPGFRFSVVAGVSAGWNYEESALDPGGPVSNVDEFGDVRFRRIQVRALGQIPFINDSFFLLSLRLENSPRLSFAMFQVPLFDTGHYINVNSGSGGLSSGLIVSASKQPLLDPPFYLFNAFEQGNGAAVEVGGPIGSLLRYRAFVAGGSGFFNGNVGGVFFREGTRNFAWNAGAQLQLNIAGYYDRFDTPFLYTSVPLTVALVAGGKYDQREAERFPAWNVHLHVSYWRFLMNAELYQKYVLDYGGAFQTAWNAQLSFLIVPKWLMLAGDVGSFYAQDFAGTPVFDAFLRRPLDELQWRVALHLYWFRNIGVLSAMFSEDRIEENPDNPADAILVREFRVESQLRF